MCECGGVRLCVRGRGEESEIIVGLVLKIKVAIFASSLYARVWGEYSDQNTREILWLSFIGKESNFCKQQQNFCFLPFVFVLGDFQKPG